MPPSADIRSRADWVRLLVGLGVVFVLFQWSATKLGSDRGQAGVVVCLLVVTATLIFERAWFSPNVRSAAVALGLGAPTFSGLVATGVVSLLLALVVPVYAAATGVTWAIQADALSRLPGLFAQAGIAEETLFRGYLFGHLRRTRSFWRAATLSTIPFIAVHLFMFLTMPWPIALAGLLLSVVISFPLARLFELGGGTIWPPALLHFVVQGTVKLVDVARYDPTPFPMVWIAASALIPLCVFSFSRPLSATQGSTTVHTGW